MATTRPRVFLDVNVGTEPAGRLVIELFIDKAPKACENFRALCSGSHPPLTYKLSRFHRIIDEFMVQGGDITKGDGTGGDSIYGGEFADENLGWRDLDSSNLVAAANRGKDTNSSQFFITLAPSPHLNAKHTVFGHLVSGQETLSRMAQVAVDSGDKPLTEVIVSHCGELERHRKELSSKATAAGKRASKQVSSDSQSSDRGRGKRRRSEDSDRSNSHNSKFRKHAHPPSRSPLREGIPIKRRHRRRSDLSVDETARGRPRRRSEDRMRRSSPIEEDGDLSMEDDKPTTPRHGRKRSQSPSRYRQGDSSQSQGFRRRRSLPNHYERRQVQPKNVEGSTTYGRDQPKMDKEQNYGKWRESRQQVPRSNAKEGRLGNDIIWDEDDTASAGSEIKFKGRGSMKYRERNK